MGIYDENAPDDFYIDFSDDYIDKIFKEFGLDKLFNKEE